MMPTQVNYKAKLSMEARQRVETAYAVASVLVAKSKPATRRDVTKQLLFFKTPILLEMAKRTGVKL